MNRSTHPVEPEELMAYLDAEVPAERAASVAAHVEECAECRELVTQFRSISEHLAAWQVEPSPASLAERVLAGSAPVPSAPRRPLLRRWVWGLAGSFALLLLVFAISVPNLLRSRMSADQASRQARERAEWQYSAEKDSLRASRVAGAAPAPTASPSGPMIIRTASLALVTKEFDNARPVMEGIVRRHQGYIAQLSLSGPSGQERTLTATLRVPANQLDAALAELRKLGRVEQESQGGEEVTQQYVDLVARLSNARNTEQRLIEVLRQRTGKVADILAVEKEIARVREEIERMEAERKSLEKQVSLATVQLRLSEEARKALEPAPASTGTLLWNAMVEGFREAVEEGLGLVLFLLRYGPSLLLWLALLFWPVRFAWRRFRARLKA